MTKKDKSKKLKNGKATKGAAKKVSKKIAAKKTSKPATKKTKKVVAKKAKIATPKTHMQEKPKKVTAAKSKIAKVAAKKTAKVQPAKKRESDKAKGKATPVIKPVKQRASVKPALPPMEEKKPKGTPTQLSMALEEKETQHEIVKPRITRSKSGNHLFQLEYTIRSSPTILYEFLTTPSGLAQWFADSVDINDHHCTFVWEGYPEYATIIDSIPDEYIRYRWDNSDEDEYFEFRISKNEITSDTILTITDFASQGEMNDQKLLWDSQIKTLVQQVGG